MRKYQSNGEFTEEYKARRRKDIVNALQEIAVDGVAPARTRGNAPADLIYSKGKSVFSNWHEMVHAAGLMTAQESRYGCKDCALQQRKKGDLRRALGYFDTLQD